VSVWLPRKSRNASASTSAGEAGGGASPPAIFVDRDGCLIVERHYLADPELVELIPGAAAALRSAREAGYLLIGLSNQSGVGRGRFGEDELAAVFARLHALLDAEGAALDGYFYCPHAPEEGCVCRKPEPGLLAEAAEYFVWDERRSWTVGDKISDLDLGLRAGLGSVLVRTGYGRDQEGDLGDRHSRGDVVVADDLPAAVAAILARGGG